LKKDAKYNFICSRTKTQNYLQAQERELLMKFSVFNHFNHSLLEKIYPNESFSMSNLIYEKESLFDKFDYSYKLKKSYKDILNKYFSLKDVKLYNDIKENIIKYWNEKKAEIEKELKELQNEKINEENLLFKNENELENTLFDIKNIKNSINTKKNKISQFDKSNKIDYTFNKIYLIGLAICIPLFILSFVINNTIGIVLFCFSVLITSFSIFNIFNSRIKQKSALRDTENKYILLENKINELNKNLNDKEKRTFLLENDIDKSKKRINDINEKIKQLSSILREPYI
jgi:predicted  nucleic acid-binding Zn-ribbon protein